jgi:phospholipid transport system transporter-binding protein
MQVIMIDVQIKDSLAIFSGVLTRETISRAFDKKYRQLADKTEITFDLGAVSQVDTAGLAWILLTVELAHKQNNVLKLINLPNDLVKLATLSAVDSMLPVDNT